MGGGRPDRRLARAAGQHVGVDRQPARRRRGRSPRCRTSSPARVVLNRLWPLLIVDGRRGRAGGRAAAGPGGGHRLRDHLGVGVAAAVLGGDGDRGARRCALLRRAHVPDAPDPSRPDPWLPLEPVRARAAPARARGRERSGAARRDGRRDPRLARLRPGAARRPGALRGAGGAAAGPCRPGSAHADGHRLRPGPRRPACRAAVGGRRAADLLLGHRRAALAPAGGHLARHAGRGESAGSPWALAARRRAAAARPGAAGPGDERALAGIARRPSAGGGGAAGAGAAIRTGRGRAGHRRAGVCRRPGQEASGRGAGGVARRPAGGRDAGDRRSRRRRRTRGAVRRAAAPRGVPRPRAPQPAVPRRAPDRGLRDRPARGPGRRMRAREHAVSRSVPGAGDRAGARPAARDRRSGERDPHRARRSGAPVTRRGRPNCWRHLRRSAVDRTLRERVLPVLLD